MVRFNLLRALIVYDTVSPSRVTEIVAVTIGQVLKKEGIKTDTVFVADVSEDLVKSFDCLLVGAPTMAFKASKAIIKFLDGLKSSSFNGKPALAFDTQMQSRLSGSAVKGIEGKLRSLGFKLDAAPLVTYVKRGAGQNEWQLKEGELEKTKAWALKIGQSLSKQHRNNDKMPPKT